MAFLAGEFDETEIEYWPDVRWWLAEGMNTDATLEKNVQQLHDYGFGAAEFLAMVEPGTADAIYGWGSDELNSDTRLIIEKATELGVGFSLTSGTHWSHANLPNTYTWAPEGGEPAQLATAPEIDLVLQGVVAVKVITPRTDAGGGEGTEYAEGYEGTGQGVLDFASIVDLTSKVTGDGSAESPYKVSFTPSDSSDYVLLAYYMHGTGQTGVPSVSVNYTVNYMDSYGMEALTDYWGEYMLTDEIADTIRKNGRGEIYMDSLELGTNSAGGLFWGYNFMEEFRARRNYDLTPYLPFVTKVSGRVGNAGHVWDYLPNSDEGKSVIAKVQNDLFQTTTEMYYENVLQVLQDFLRGYNMKLRAEPSYGFSFEISTPAKYIDGIETESYAQSADTDIYRGILGSAHMYDRLFSSETGAIRGHNYIFNMDYWTQLCKVQFANGVNRTVFHGYSGIEGSEQATYWPGHEGMYPYYSLRLSSRQPASGYYPEWTQMLARNQKALRAGKPRVDVAIFRTDYNYYLYGRDAQAEGGPEGRIENNYMQQDKASHWQDLRL